MRGGSWAGALALSLMTSLGFVAISSAEAAPEERHRAAEMAKPPKPTVSKVKPASGLTTGGTKVTIKGEHLNGATKVLFGELKGTKVKVKSDHKLTVVAPPQVSGVIDVRVKTKGGKSKTGKKARFTYLLAPPTLTGLGTTSGPYVGGTRVTVTGTDFEQVNGVTFGGTPGTALTVLSPTQLAVTTPAHEAGSVGVVVSTTAGSTGAASFSFVAVPSAITAPIPAGVTPSAGDSLSLDYVACTTPPLCFAVGTVDDVTRGYLPVIERRTAPGSWVPTSPALPPDSTAPADVGFWDLDCGSPTLCVAVGYYEATAHGRLLALTWNGATWSSQAITEPTTPTGQSYLTGVDCPTSTTCVAVGNYTDAGTNDERPLVTSFNGSAWSAAQAVPMPPSTDEAYLEDVDCFSPTQCVAVGYRYASGDQFPYLATLSGGVWQAAPVVVPAGAASDPDAELAGVSCFVAEAAGQCVAVGSYLEPSGRVPFITRFANGGPPGWTSTEVPLPGDAMSDPDSELTFVSCVSTTECRAVGDYAQTGGSEPSLLARVSAGTPTSEAGPLPPSTALGQDIRYGDLSCRAIDACLAVGSYLVNAVDDSGSYVQTLGPGGWSAAAAPVPPGTLTSSLWDVAHLGTAGVMVGQHATAAGRTGMLVELPSA